MRNQSGADVASSTLHLGWRGIIAFVALVMATVTAEDVRSAEFNEIPSNDGTEIIITIEGEIKSGDDEKFRAIAAKHSKAIVFLNSEGGAIVPAMDIGRTVKLRGYKTVVSDTDSCASACALIWVSGSQRVLFEGGAVGFHASYLDTDGTRLETGLGNALVGRYLTQLGFGEKTVIFATLAPPDKVLWLNDETVSMSGIDFDTIPKEPVVQKNVAITKQSTPSLTVQTPPPLVRTVTPPLPGRTSNQKLMGDAKQTLRSPEAFAQALRQKGFQATVSYKDQKAPTINTGVGGNEIVLYFSGCDQGGCSYIQLLDYITDATKEEANLILYKASREEFYSHPVWLDKTKLLAFYNYILIGEDGITANTLIENMRYFVKTNDDFANVILKKRSE